MRLSTRIRADRIPVTPILILNSRMIRFHLVIFVILVAVSSGFGQATEPIRSEVASVRLVDDVEVANIDPGIVVEVLVKRGDKVKKGQALVRLNSDIYETELTAAEIELKIADLKARVVSICCMRKNPRR